MRHGADDKKLGNWYYWSLNFYYLAFLPEADDSLMKCDQGEVWELQPSEIAKQREQFLKKRVEP